MTFASLTRLLLGNGSDVFGSDICTCKPYLIFAIEECVRCAQRGGVGVVVYFRKEGRALGEVTKCVALPVALHYPVLISKRKMPIGTSFTTCENVAATEQTDTSSRRK